MKKKNKILLTATGIVGMLMLGAPCSYMHYSMINAYEEKKERDLYKIIETYQHVSTNAIELGIKFYVEDKGNKAFKSKKLVDPNLDDMSLFFQDKLLISENPKKNTWQDLYNTSLSNLITKKHQKPYRNMSPFVYKNMLEKYEQLDFEHKEEYIASCYLYPLANYVSIYSSKINPACYMPFEHAKLMTERSISDLISCIDKQIDLLDGLNFGTVHKEKSNYIGEKLLQQITKTTNDLSLVHPSQTHIDDFDKRKEYIYTFCEKLLEKYHKFYDTMKYKKSSSEKMRLIIINEVLKN